MISLFPELYRIADFIDRNHPDIHPKRPEYIQYWRQQKKYCIEGKWGLDAKIEDPKNPPAVFEKGGWRYMPNFLYFFVNIWKIKDIDEETKTENTISPDLMDTGWIIGYDMLTCDGFSGFEGDKNITCHRLVDKYWKAKQAQVDDNGTPILLTKKEKEKLDTLPHIHREDGRYKDFVDPVEYLHRTFPEPMGNALYWNNATDYILMGTRGGGKSYIMAARIAYNFLFDGQKYFVPDAKKGIGSSFAGANSEDQTLLLIQKIEFGLDNLPGGFKDQDYDEPPPFSKTLKGSWNVKSEITHTYKKTSKGKNGKTEKSVGTGSKISFGIFTTENPDAAVGGRKGFIGVDELGLIPNIVKVHTANKNVTKVERLKYGWTMYGGTGGNIEKIEGTQDLFYNPVQQGILAFKNIWEGGSDICRFLPAYMVLRDFKDPLGNTDVAGAYQFIMDNREALKKGPDKRALDAYIMYEPVKPSEMFINVINNIFPINALRERALYLETSKELSRITSWGKLTFVGEKETGSREVRWHQDLTGQLRKKQITGLNLDIHSNDLTGAITIFEHPEPPPEPFSMTGLYKVGYDWFKDDGKGGSLAVVTVYKGFTSNGYNMGLQDTIVAEWVGRTSKVSDAHWIAISLALYYQALIMQENVQTEFISHCKNNGYEFILAFNPFAAVSKGVKNPTAKYQYGVHMSKELKEHTDKLINEDLRKDWQLNNEGVMMSGVDKLYSLRFIQEAANYGSGNFDYISAYRMIVLWNSNSKPKVHEPPKVKKKVADDDPIRKAYNQIKRKELVWTN